MRTYDYLCQTCTELFEKRVKHKDEKVKCPVCGSFLTERIILEVPAMRIEWEPSYAGDMGFPALKKRVRNKRFSNQEEA